jgi:hypothetical protein
LWWLAVAEAVACGAEAVAGKPGGAIAVAPSDDLSLFSPLLLYFFFSFLPLFFYFFFAFDLQLLPFMLSSLLLPFLSFVLFFFCLFSAFVFIGREGR